MAEKTRISTPAGSAGIFRFYDVPGRGIKIEPTWVILICILFILGILILNFAI